MLDTKKILENQLKLNGMDFIVGINFNRSRKNTMPISKEEL